MGEQECACDSVHDVKPIVCKSRQIRARLLPTSTLATKHHKKPRVSKFVVSVRKEN